MAPIHRTPPVPVHVGLLHVYLCTRRFGEGNDGPLAPHTSLGASALGLQGFCADSDDEESNRENMQPEKKRLSISPIGGVRSKLSHALMCVNV